MKSNPIIVLIDMDCFYVQVELKDAPQYIGKESAVVQYNTWRGGGIIAVSYEARAKGVNRSMRGDEARQKCPDIHLFSVPENRGKADLTKYRNAGAEVIKCLSKHASCVERASIDEAFIDITDEVDNLLVSGTEPGDGLAMLREWSKHSIEGCHVIGYDSYSDWLSYLMELCGTDDHCDDVRLALGGFLVQQMRDDVFHSLGFRCSAGIAHSKTTAKFACGVHKPNQQTVVPRDRIPDLLNNASIDKIRNLGGKMGSYVQDQLNISTIGELSAFSLNQLTDKFSEKTGSWLYYLCRGQDDESVLSRQLAQSIGCSKRFPGSSHLNTIEKVRYWLEQMAQEVAERINEDRSTNARLPTHMCVSYRQLRDGNDSRKSLSGSRVVPLKELTATGISGAAFVVLSGINTAGQRDLADCTWFPSLVSLGLSVGKFKPQMSKNDISRFLIDIQINKSVVNTPNKSVPLDDSNSVTMDSVVSDSSLRCANDESNSSIDPPLHIIAPTEPPAVPHRPQTVSEPFKGPPKKKGFFARYMENEERIEKEDRDSASSSDYYYCDQCCKQILMWDVPEHSDWHVAKALQKEISENIYEEERKSRLVKQNANSKIKGKQISKPSKSNQLKIDQFFTK